MTAVIADCEVWSVQHGSQPPPLFSRDSPARSRGPRPKSGLLFAACPYARTVLRGSDRRFVALSSPYPLLKRTKEALRWLQTGLGQAVLTRAHLHLHLPARLLEMLEAFCL